MKDFFRPIRLWTSIKKYISIQSGRVFQRRMTALTYLCNSCNSIISKFQFIGICGHQFCEKCEFTYLRQEDLNESVVCPVGNCKTEFKGFDLVKLATAQSCYPASYFRVKYILVIGF